MKHSTPEEDLQPVAALLSGKVLPHFEERGCDRLVVAHIKEKELDLPPAVKVSRKLLRGSRIGVKGKRDYGNVSLITARWKEDQQEVTRAPALSFVLAGQADMQIGNYVLHIPEGYAFLIPPGVPHPDGNRPHLEGARVKDGSCDILTVALRGEKVQLWMCYSRGSKHLGPNPGESIFILSPRCAQYLDALNEDLVAGKSDSQLICNGLLATLLLTIRREIREGHFLSLEKARQDTAHPSTGFNSMEQAQNYIRSHLNEPLTLQSVAHAVYMSRSQFAKKFHEHTNLTFTTYLNQARLEQAQVFLRETNWSMAHIAEFVGFKSASYFHRLFRNEFGSSPQEYRIAHISEAGSKIKPQKAAPKKRSMRVLNQK
jgi:AraC-like DNA-binding protein